MIVWLFAEKQTSNFIQFFNSICPKRTLVVLKREAIFGQERTPAGTVESFNPIVLETAVSSAA
jgi:hypothetical protein